MTSAFVLLLTLSAYKPNFDMQYMNTCYPDEGADTCSRRQERWKSAMEQYNKEVAAEAAQELEALKANVFVVEPAPGREKVPAQSPKWCKGADGGEVSGLRAMPTNTRSFVEQNRYFSWRSAVLAAQSACIAPDNEDIKRQTGYLLQAVVNVVGYSGDEASADLAARLDEKGLIAAKEKLCAAVKPGAEAEGDNKALAQANAQLFGCGESSKLDYALWADDRGVDSNPVVYFLDSAAQPESELLRFAWLITATRWWDQLSESPYLAMSYAMVQVDLADFDPAKVKAETSVAPYAGNPWAKIVISESLGTYAMRKPKYDEAVAALTKDDGWKEILVTAPKKAVKEWTVRAEKFKPALDHSREFEKKAFGPSLKAAKGCSATQRADFGAYLKTVKASPADFGQTVLGDPVGSVLLERLSACEALEGNGAFAGMLRGTWEQGRVQRGPRLAAMYAAIEALGEVKKDRPRFPLGPDAVHPPYNNDLRDRVADKTTSVAVKFYGTAETGSVVKSVSKTPKGTKVVFITEKVTYPAHDCWDTNKIMGIDSNGTIRYYRKCEFGKRMVTDTHHLEDALIPNDLAAGIKPGTWVEVTRSGETALPLMVYSDKSRKTQVAWRGFAL